MSRQRAKGTRFERLFGTPERAVGTLLSIKCLDDGYESCEGCPFWSYALQHECPQYMEGRPQWRGVGKPLAAWMKEES